MLLVVVATIFTTAFTEKAKVQAEDGYDVLRAKWKTMLTGGENYDVTDPNIAAAITGITEEATTVRSTMDKSGTKNYLWSDCNSGSVSAQLTTAYGRIRSMALAYNTYGSTLYHDADLRSDILYALDWYNTNKYYDGKKSYQNWWDWQIGVPLALNDIVILMYDELSTEQITAYMNAVEFYQPTVTMTGANRAWECEIIGVRGVIVKDDSKIAAAMNGLSSLFDYVTGGDGFYRDGSFVQHNYYAYSGGYGRSLLESVSNLLYLFDGSAWDTTDTDVDNVFQWVYDTYAPVIYKGNLMDMVRGREISREHDQDNLSSHLVMSSIFHLADIAGGADAAAFKSLIKNWLQADTTNGFLADAGIEMIQKAEALLNDPTVAAAQDTESYHQFLGMDRVVKTGVGYSFGISMNSDRIANFESINGENARGWHTSDGMTYLYNGDTSQFNDNFWPTVNAYRLSGTTVLQNTTSTPHLTNGSKWVGGSNLYGVYGTNGMELQSMDYTLTGKKSWFLFDDEIVALGSGITSTDGITAETIIENRKINDSGSNVLTVNGVQKSSNLGWSETMTGVRSINLEGNVSGAGIGYYFPTGTTVQALREARTGKWKDVDTRATASTTMYTRNYMTLWVDHGMNPSASTYAYAILPNQTAEQTLSYTSSPEITILENSEDAQGVKETSLNITSVNFWTDGGKRVGIITSNRKSSVMVKENSGDIDISVADPTGLATEPIIIELQKRGSSVIAADPGVEVLQLAPTIKLSVSTVGALRGKNFTVKIATGGNTAHVVPANITLPLIQETEQMQMLQTSASHKVSGSSIASGGSYALFNGKTVGDYIDYKMSIPKAGTYRLIVRTLKSNNAGIFEVKIGDQVCQNQLDAYCTTSNYQEVDLGSMSFDVPGDYVIRFTAVGKNNSSSGYKMSFDSIMLTLPDVWEMQQETCCLEVLGTSAGDGYAVINDNAAGGGTLDKFFGNAVNDYIEYALNIMEPGDYHVTLHVKQTADSGMYQTYVNGVSSGDAMDCYDAAQGYAEFDIGMVHFDTAGDVALRLTVVGKNEGANGYKLLSDYITLTKE